MGKSSKYSKNKQVKSSNENIIQRENGSTILRREKVFTDGSRLVEESYIDDGSELLEEAAVPLVNASVYGNNIEGDVNNAATSARKRHDQQDSEMMLQPKYNTDGWLPGVIMMMICRYSGCIFLWWIIIKIIQRIVTRRTTADVVTSTINNSFDPYSSNNFGINQSSGGSSYHHTTAPTFISTILIGFILSYVLGVEGDLVY